MQAAPTQQAEVEAENIANSPTSPSHQALKFHTQSAQGAVEVPSALTVFGPAARATPSLRWPVLASWESLDQMAPQPRSVLSSSRSQAKAVSPMAPAVPVVLVVREAQDSTEVLAAL